MDNHYDVTVDDSDIIYLGTFRPTETLDGIFAAEHELDREVNGTPDPRYGSLSPESRDLFRYMFGATPTLRRTVNPIRTPSPSTTPIPIPALRFTPSPTEDSLSSAHSDPWMPYYVSTSPASSNSTIATIRFTPTPTLSLSLSPDWMPENPLMSPTYVPNSPSTYGLPRPSTPPMEQEYPTSPTYIPTSPVYYNPHCHVPDEEVRSGYATQSFTENLPLDFLDNGSEVSSLSLGNVSTLSAEDLVQVPERYAHLEMGTMATHHFLVAEFDDLTAQWNEMEREYEEKKYQRHLKRVRDDYEY